MAAWKNWLYSLSVELLYLLRCPSFFFAILLLVFRELGSLGLMQQDCGRLLLYSVSCGVLFKLWMLGCSKV